MEFEENRTEVAVLGPTVVIRHERPVTLWRLTPTQAQAVARALVAAAERAAGTGELACGNN